MDYRKPPQCRQIATVRSRAPDFQCEAVIDGCFEERSLQFYMARQRWLMIFFIPMAWSFVCPTEVLAFDNVLEEFEEQHCSLIFVSTDSKYSLHSWQARPKNDGGLGGIKVPLLSDQSHKMSRAYGVLVEDEGIALRGRFIINPEGIVKHISINDVAVARSVLESLRLIQAYKMEYEHGALCAANWKPGEKGMEPTSEAAQAHINKHFGEAVAAADQPLSTSGLSRTFSTDSVAGEHDAKASQKRGAPKGPHHHRVDSGTGVARSFAMEAIHKVLGGLGHETQAPMTGADEMNALNDANEKSGLQGPESLGAQHTYFEYEPYPPSPNLGKRADAAQSLTTSVEHSEKDE